MSEAIYKLEFDCGRNGYLTGIFVAEKTAIANAFGKTIYFGEVLGKHSDISGRLEKNDIKMITDDQEAVEMFKKYKFESGYNPLDYIRDDDDE